MIPPPGFEWVRDGRVTSLVRSDLRSWLMPLLRTLDDTRIRDAAGEIEGGRGGSRVVRASDHEIVVRSFRRGGLPARLLRDVYVGWNPRPFRELYATETLRRRGAPVVEVYAARVRWLLPGCYKGWLVTRYLSGARTLWQWARAAENRHDPDVLLRVGHAIRHLHDTGACHPDLNLNNILICSASAGVPEVVFIDFDRSRLSPRFCATPEADLARLRRSARKLDPTGETLTDADLARLESAYRESSSCG